SGIATLMRSDRALALAADDLERRLLGPVDEVVHVLQAELDRHREVLDPCLELLRPDTVDESVELLPVTPLGFVEAYPSLHRLRHALGREPRLETLAVADVAALVRATDMRDVGGNRVVADLDRSSVEPDVRDVVLAAAVRAAAHLDVDAAGQRVVDLHLDELVLDGLVEPHRARDPELAGIGARAAHHVGDLVGAGVVQAEL